MLLLPLPAGVTGGGGAEHAGPRCAAHAMLRRSRSGGAAGAPRAGARNERGHRRASSQRHVAGGGARLQAPGAHAHVGCSSVPALLERAMQHPLALRHTRRLPGPPLRAAQRRAAPRRGGRGAPDPKAAPRLPPLLATHAAPAASTRADVPPTRVSARAVRTSGAALPAACERAARSPMRARWPVGPPPPPQTTRAGGRGRGTREARPPARGLGAIWTAILRQGGSAAAVGRRTGARHAAD